MRTFGHIWRAKELQQVHFGYAQNKLPHSNFIEKSQLVIRIITGNQSMLLAQVNKRA